MATSNDERHPPEFIISASEGEFWMSTGLYPQEVIIEFNPPKQFRTVRISSTNLRQITLEGSESNTLSGSMSLLGKSEIGRMQGSLQRETLAVSSSRPVALVKLNILSGWDEFVSIHSLVFD